MPGISLTADMRRMLTSIGAQMVVQSAVELFGAPPRSIGLFSDYGGEANEPYETYATYVCHWNAMGPLLDALDRFRAERRFPARVVEFKNRKKVPAKVPGAWVRGFATVPGLLVVMCWARRIRGHAGYKANMAELQQSLTDHGLTINAKQTESILRKLAFLSVIGHLREPDEPMFWFSDNDKIFDGRCAEATQEAFATHLTRMFGPEATAPITLMTPQMLRGGPEFVDGVSVEQIRLAQERLLSIADLAAGTLAVSLPAPYSQGKEFAAPDAETRDILEALTYFGSPLERSAAPGKLLVLAVQPAPSDDRLQIEGVALRRA